MKMNTIYFCANASKKEDLVFLISFAGMRLPCPLISHHHRLELERSTGFRARKQKCPEEPAGWKTEVAGEAKG